MKTKFTITIKERTPGSWIIGGMLVLLFLLGALNELLLLPESIRYGLDAAWALLLVMMVVMRKNCRMCALTLWIGAFLIYVGFVYIARYQSILYFLWGIRNNFRFFVFFFAVAVWLTPEDVAGYFKLFDVIFWINLPVTLLQYTAFQLTHDYLGGIFGTEQGVNGYTNLFFVVVATYSVVACMAKKESLWYTLLKCAAMLLISALVELRFFFVEFILILVLATLFTGFSWRKLWLILGGIAAVVIFAAILTAIYPEFVGFLTLETLLEAGSSDKGYSGTDDLNRLTAISKINELWLLKWQDRMFGLGLGNCDTSQNAALDTDFYRYNGDLHYTWMSLAFMYLECGWFGLIFYFGFFVLVFVQTMAIEKRCGPQGKFFCRVVRIVALLCPLIIVYNASLRTEAAYLIYFVLAIPFVFKENRRVRKDLEAIGCRRF